MVPQHVFYCGRTCTTEIALCSRDKKNPLSSGFRTLVSTRKSSVHSKRGQFLPHRTPCLGLLTPTMPTIRKASPWGSVLAYRKVYSPLPQVWPAVGGRQFADMFCKICSDTCLTTCRKQERNTGRSSNVCPRANNDIWSDLRSKLVLINPILITLTISTPPRYSPPKKHFQAQNRSNRCPNKLPRLFKNSHGETGWPQGLCKL